MTVVGSAPVLWPRCLLFDLVLSPLGPHSAFVLCHVLFFDLGLPSGLKVCDRALARCNAGPA